MRRKQLSANDGRWFWLSLCAAACAVSGALVAMSVTSWPEQYKKAKRSRNKYSRRTRGNRSGGTANLMSDDSEEEPFTADGEQSLELLRQMKWYHSASTFLERLHFSSLDDLQLASLVGELWFILKKNVISLEVACERFRNMKYVTRMFQKVLKVYRDAVIHLKRFADGVLGMDFANITLSAEAQSYPHCLCFLSHHGSCVEIVAALATSFPSWSRVCGKLQDELNKTRREWKKSHFIFFDKLSKSVKRFDEVAVKAFDDGIRKGNTSWERIVRSSKALLESETLFWKSILAGHSELPLDTVYSVTGSPKASSDHDYYRMSYLQNRKNLADVEDTGDNNLHDAKLPIVKVAHVYSETDSPKVLSNHDYHMPHLQNDKNVTDVEDLGDTTLRDAKLPSIAKVALDCNNVAEGVQSEEENSKSVPQQDRLPLIGSRSRFLSMSRKEQEIEKNDMMNHLEQLQLEHNLSRDVHSPISSMEEDSAGYHRTISSFNGNMAEMAKRLIELEQY